MSLNNIENAQISAANHSANLKEQSTPFRQEDSADNLVPNNQTATTFGSFSSSSRETTNQGQTSIVLYDHLSNQEPDAPITDH